MTAEPRFDIFCGADDKNAVWKDCVEGLAKARARMEELAAQKPGMYFIFSSYSHSILAKIDTTKDIKRAEDIRAKKQSA